MLVLVPLYLVAHFAFGFNTSRSKPSPRTEPHPSMAAPLTTPPIATARPPSSSPSAQVLVMDVRWGDSRGTWSALRTPLPPDEQFGLTPAYGPVLSTGVGEITGVVFTAAGNATGFSVNFESHTTLSEAQARIAKLMPTDARADRPVLTRECGRQYWSSSSAVKLLGPSIDGSPFGPFVGYFSGSVGVTPRALNPDEVTFANVSFSQRDLLPPCG